MERVEELIGIRHNGHGMRGVPRVGLLNGGAIDETFDPRHSEGNDELPLPLEYFPDCVAARIRGRSMEPKYNDGDWVILHRVNCEDVRSGWICYVEMHDGTRFGGTLKKIVVQGDTLLLLPVNEGEYEPIPVRCEHVKLMSRAVGKYVPYVKGFGFDRS